MKKILLSSLVVSQSLFAIVSITPIDIGEQVGVHGNIAGSLETKRGNTEKDSYKASTKIVYDNNSTGVTWGEINGEYGKTNNQTDTNNIYLHIRHIHALNAKTLRAEGFVQVQSDRFKQIRRRSLLGADLRYKLEFLKNAKGYIAGGLMGEKIDYISTVDSDENNIRVSSYLSYSIDLTKDAQLSALVYYQPKVDDFNDYINTNKVTLELKVYKELYLNFGISYDIDSKPPVGVKSNDFTQNTSFIYKF